MIRTATTFLAIALCALLASSAAAQAPWQKRANAICAQFARDADKLQSEKINALPTGDEQAARNAVADLFTDLANLSLASDSKLTALTVPVKQRAAFTKAIRKDRLANGRLPLQAAELLRGPAGDKSAETQYEQLRKRTAMLNEQLAASYTKLGIRKCATGAAPAPDAS